MSDIGKTALKNKIDAKIYDNESQLITGAILNEVLQDAVDTLADGGNLDAGSVDTANLNDEAVTEGKLAEGILQKIDWSTASQSYYRNSQAGNVAAKTLTTYTNGYVMRGGGSLKVTFENVNTADNATLNIDSTGAKPLYYNGARVSSTNSWAAGETVEIFYNNYNSGIYYARSIDFDSEPTSDSGKNVTSGVVKEALDNVQADADCAIAANSLYYNTQLGDVAAKVVNATGYTLFAGGSIKVHFEHKNTASTPTLNVNGTGAHQMTYNGSLVSDTNSWEDGETVEFFYDAYNVGLWHGHKASPLNVSVSQNSQTGHTNINIGNETQQVASVDEVDILNQKVNGVNEGIDFPTTSDYYINCSNKGFILSGSSAIKAIYVQKGCTITVKNVGGATAVISRSLVPLDGLSNAEIASLLDASPNLVVLTANTNTQSDRTNIYTTVAGESGWYVLCGLVDSFVGGVYFESYDEKINETENQISVIQTNIDSLEKDIDGSDFRIINVNLVKDGFSNHLFDAPIESGTLIRALSLKDSSFQLSSCYFVDENGNIDININTITAPYVTTKKYIGYAANSVGSLMLFMDGKMGLISSRKTIHIARTDSMTSVVDKLYTAYIVRNVDVFFDKGTYTIDDTIIDYIVKFYTAPSRIGLPLGKNCRYYLNGSTIIVNQTERYSNGKEVSCFDSLNAYVYNWEINDGVLINNNSKYCVHDETSGTAVPYTNKLKNVTMIAQNGAQCTYGCGIGYDTNIIFENCIFRNDGSAVSAFNMVFHSPNNPNSAIKFNLSFEECYFDDNTTISVGTTGFDVTRDSLSLIVSNSHYTNSIPSYVLDIFNQKYIW